MAVGRSEVSAAVKVGSAYAGKARSAAVAGMSEVSEAVKAERAYEAVAVHLEVAVEKMAWELHERKGTVVAERGTGMRRSQVVGKTWRVVAEKE